MRRRSTWRSQGSKVSRNRRAESFSASTREAAPQCSLINPEPTKKPAALPFTLLSTCLAAHQLHPIVVLQMLAGVILELILVNQFCMDIAAWLSVYGLGGWLVADHAMRHFPIRLHNPPSLRLHPFETRIRQEGCDAGITVVYQLPVLNQGQIRVAVGDCRNQSYQMAATTAC